MRNTTDKKDKVIRIRISEEMSEWLYKKTDNVSRYIRELITKDMDSGFLKQTK